MREASNSSTKKGKQRFSECSKQKAQTCRTLKLQESSMVTPKLGVSPHLKLNRSKS